MTWVVFIGLAAVLFYSYKKEQPAHDEAARRSGKALPRSRVARIFGSLHRSAVGPFYRCCVLPYLDQLRNH